jgi:uncharacterized protein (TIGR01319 family)
MPEIGKIDSAPCNQQVRNIFVKSIVEAKGIGRARQVVKDVIMPTPSAVLSAARLFSEGCDEDTGLGELVVVDPGGATTDIHSIAEGKPAMGGVVMRGLPEPYVKRTVEGDLGVRHNIATLLELRQSRHNLPGCGFEITDEMLPAVEQLPETEREQALDYMLAAVSVEIAMERHAGVIESIYGPTGEMFVQYGKDLTGVRSVVGTGGPIIFSTGPRSILERVLFRAEAPHILRPKSPAFYVDERYILFGAGLLAQADPAAALALMRRYVRQV